MNWKPTGIRNVFRTLEIVAIALMASADVFAAQQTNVTNRADFSSFQVINERNIFNPSRTARRRNDKAAPPVADMFSLVGTMSYAKGKFAFFDGTGSEYRKALPNAGTIAGYTVTDITPTAVKLANGDKQLVMKIGTEMRREEKGAWQLAGNTELPASTVEKTAGATPDTVSSDSSGEENDVLKRLMKQREEESQ